MTARTASAITSTLGILYAAVSVVFDPDNMSAIRNFGIGLLVAGVGWLIHGLCDWMGARPGKTDIETLDNAGECERAAS